MSGASILSQSLFLAHINNSLGLSLAPGKGSIGHNFHFGRDEYLLLYRFFDQAGFLGKRPRFKAQLGFNPQVHDVFALEALENNLIFAPNTR